jgi:hypothetical protein
MNSFGHSLETKMGPKCMGQNFSKARDLHHHSTRGKQYNFVVPNANGMTSTTFYFNAIKDWNSLPTLFSIFRIPTSENTV